MNSSKNKRDVFYFTVLVLTLVVMLVGITFTYFSLLASDKKDSTRLQTGTLAINYIDGRAIDTSLLLPINEPNLDTEYSVYKKHFSVKSSGTLDQTMDMYIDVTKNDFADNALHFALYDSSNTKVRSGSIPSEGKVLMENDIYLKSGETKEFTVLIWLQENNQNQDYEQGSSFVGGFEINARQVKLK